MDDTDKQKPGPKPRPRKPRRRTIVLALAVNVLIVVTIVGCLEFVGWLHVRLPASHVVPSWRLNHKWKPNSKFEHPGWAKTDLRFPKPYTHVYNRQSWIETYDVEPRKPPGTFRIFYLGDSFVEGPMPMKQSLPSIVERRLNARGHGVRIEVINTGTSSYSPTIYYVLIRYVIAKYDADLIVLCVDMTDDYDDWKYSQTAIADASGNPVAVPPRNLYTSAFVDTPAGAVRATPLARLELFLYRNSYCYNWLLSRRLRAQAQASAQAPAKGTLYPRWAWCQHTWDKATEANAGRTLDMLRRICELCKARGVKLVLTSVPHHPQYSAGPDGGGPPMWSDRPHREIAKVAAREGVPYLDAFSMLAPRFRGSKQTDYYYCRDMHLNPIGCALWAECHVKFLSAPSRKLLPQDSATKPAPESSRRSPTFGR